MADTTARIRLALEGQGQVVQGMKQVEDGTASLRRSMASLVGGLSLGATVGQLVQVQREFDVLNSSLITVTGSSAAAEREMRWIKEFAATTPYGLNEVTGAFVKMKSLGLDPSQKALTSYGNTASAMGKSLNQMVEAVADASTGEFERLKEFGIKAKKQGDDVSLTFRGVTTNIGNNSEEITRYLQKIGNNDFAGAMTTRAATLDGAISNLADSWDELFRTVNQGNVGGLIADSVRGANAVLGDAITIIRALNGAVSDNVRDTGAMAAIQGGLANVFETVAVVGANVKYVLVSVGQELGGIAAQAVQILQGNFAGAAAIRSQMVADSAAGRREVDETTSMILNARRLASVAATGAGQDEPRFARLLNPTVAAASGGSGSSSEDEKAAKKRLAEFQKLADTLRNDVAAGAAAAQAAQHGYNAAQTEFLRMAASPEWASFTDKQRASVAVLFEQKIAQEQAADSLKAAALATEALWKAEDTLIKGYTDNAETAAKRLQGMRDEADAAAYAEKYSISLAIAIEETALARLREQQAIEMAKGAGMNDSVVLALQAEIDARRQIIGAISSNEVRDASKKLRDDQAAEWAKTWEQVGQSFTDALMQGGKSVKQYLEGLFRTMVLRPLLAPITGAVGSVFGGPAAAGQAGGGSIMGALSSLSSAVKNFATGGANFLSGATISAQAVGAWQNAADWMATSSNNTMAGIGEFMQNNPGIGSALGVAGNAFAGYGIQKALSGGYKVGNGKVVDLATVIGSAIFGPIGGVVGGVFNRAFGRKAPVSTGSGIVGQFSTSGANVQGYNDQFAKGGWFRSNKSWTEYSAVSSDLDKFLDASLMQITGATRAYADLLGLNADAVNGITQSIKLSLAGMNAEQQQEAIMGALSGFGDKLAEQLLGTYETVYDEVAQSWFARRFLQAFTGSAPATVARQVWTPGEFVREGETAGAALSRLGTSLTAVNIVFDTLNTTLMKGSLIGADAASKLLDAFGGADAFTAQTSAYYEAFYTQAERTNTATRQLTEVMAGLGLALPESRTTFRELVEAQDLYTDAGRSTYAALIGLAPVFDQITQAAEQMGKALSDEVLRLRGLLTGSSVNSVGALQADFAIATAAARAGDAGALERLPAISQALESAASLQAVTAADLALVRGQLTASLSDTMRTLGLDVPQFAVGTNYVPRDMIAKIHEGEAIIPKAYNPAAGGNDAMVAELRAVRAELEGLRAEVRADVGHNAKTARILERVTPDGTSLSTVVAA